MSESLVLTDTQLRLPTGQVVPLEPGVLVFPTTAPISLEPPLHLFKPGVPVRATLCIKSLYAYPRTLAKMLGIDHSHLPERLKLIFDPSDQWWKPATRA